MNKEHIPSTGDLLQKPLAPTADPASAGQPPGDGRPESADAPHDIAATTRTSRAGEVIEYQGATSPMAAYMASLGENSRRPMGFALARVARILGTTPEAVPWEQLRHKHVAAIRAQLEDACSRGECAPATANVTLAALRGVLKAAWRLDLIDSEDYHRAVDVPAVPGSRLPAGRALDLDEIRALLDACRRDPRPAAAARDRAVIALLFGAGLRRAEAAAAEMDAYDPTDESVTVIGKGGKERKVYLVDGCAELIDQWIKMRGRRDRPLLSQVNKQGRIFPARPLSDHGVMRRVTVRAQEAGLAKITPHDLRRSFVTLLLDAGADVLSVQRQAGHASATTTAKYDRRPMMAAKRAASLVSI